MAPTSPGVSESRRAGGGGRSGEAGARERVGLGEARRAADVLRRHGRGPRGGGSGGGIGSGKGNGLGDGTGGGFGGGAYKPGAGIENPQRIREVKPQYTPEAMRAKIQGTVELEAVVGPDGKVTDVRVIRSLDRVFGLDEQAKKAVLATPFIPGKKDGKPVAVLVVFELAFTLR